MKVTILEAKIKSMIKFTDDFFMFPIKVYDGFSVKKAMEQEDRDNTDEPVPMDWVVGQVRIPAKDLNRLVWHDGFSRERRVEEVAEKGFDLTIVVSDIYGEFVCTWPRKKFEDKLNEFMEKWKQSQMPVTFLPYSSTIPYGPDLIITSSASTSFPEGHEKKDT